jgi:hypothetical protein
LSEYHLWWWQRMIHLHCFLIVELDCFHELPFQKLDNLHNVTTFLIIYTSFKLRFERSSSFFTVDEMWSAVYRGVCPR